MHPSQPPISPSQPESLVQPPQVSPVAPGEPPKKSKHVAIALAASVVLLLAAGGILWWLLANRNTSTQNDQDSQQQNAQDTSTVTKVSWVVPTTLPAAYVKRDQSTTDNSLTYYTNEATACAITTGVSLLPTGKSAKNAVIDATTAAESIGVKTTSSTDGPRVTIKDTDTKHAYAFSSLQLVQSVNVKNVDFTEQQNSVAYKQFNRHMATIGIACKTQSWAGQKQALETLMQQFMVTTER